MPVYEIEITETLTQVRRLSRVGHVCVSADDEEAALAYAKQLDAEGAIGPGYFENETMDTHEMPADTAFESLGGIELDDDEAPDFTAPEKEKMDG